ncbi:hypothetical protein ABZ027_26170 [Streptomyces sp. NPDC006332]|uniref:glycoside hydrolase family 78 protein n=1 Tax=Streptomyces sp. NPDC006332 TaxID=3155456 RepID=UPI0033A68E04
MPRSRPRVGRRRLALMLPAAVTAFVTAVSGSVQATAATTHALTPAHLRTQHLDEALGIDDTTPVLSWNTTARTPGALQSAYRVQAATSPERLRSGRPDLWDSGKVTSAVPETTYAGRPLGRSVRVVGPSARRRLPGPSAGTGHHEPHPAS